MLAIVLAFIAAIVFCVWMDSRHSCYKPKKKDDNNE
ncbi:hypothetical protein EniLVp02_0010 [Vibrio phage EniLVp02]